MPDVVQRIVDALDDRRAKDIAVLDLRRASETLDYFIVATGESSLQLRALEESVRDKLEAVGVRPKGVEGPSTRWVLLDYGFVVVHIMSPEARDFYDLEGLWADAERLEVTPTPPAATPPA
ncbi:ribosome silencing factor [Truepera radiovictrix]|uniref:Ribosomal silencing factor RsfS n=1 Tax=Truepera radiovictrix (strain DSM 17093 / CIP 108686 / LMG 22925 / RQ-24) TaxID=649638 RepID=D7CWT0_TRURR|nr:ribosome silencing factor [Truepera radiovictrix]ADI13171.1 iojap-like protein [Truepera radiovictrix DSM 17093]WMT58260.1 ribosome silencing factor [Truepera radiovictrix]